MIDRNDATENYPEGDDPRKLADPPPQVVMSHGELEPNRWYSAEVEPHEEMLRAYLRRHYPSLPDVEDVVQEACARLIRARTKGTIKHAKAFLFATARNIVLDYFRRNQVVRFENVADMSELSVLDDTASAASTACREEEVAILLEAVGSLPDRCREVMTLRIKHSLSHGEIARKLGISPNTVKAHLAKGVLHCAKRFEALKSDFE